MTAAPTLPEEIARQLRREILDGRWKPGQRLPAEREIASQLGVHRSSVREALRSLEGLRLVVIRRGGGARVRPIEGASFEVVRDLLLRDGRLDDAVAQQVLDVREMLIAGAARLAAERCDDAVIVRARLLVKTLASPKTADAAFIEATEALFELMLEASGNLVLRMTRNAVHSLFAAHRLARPAPRLRSPEVLAALREIDDALARRDAAALEEAVRRFLRATQARALRMLLALAESAAPGAAALPARPIRS